MFIVARSVQISLATWPCLEIAVTAILCALLTVSTGLALRKSFCQRQQMGE